MVSQSSPQKCLWKINSMIFFFPSLKSLPAEDQMPLSQPFLHDLHMIFFRREYKLKDSIPVRSMVSGGAVNNLTLMEYLKNLLLLQ
jgi:hypothetical protein